MTKLTKAQKCAVDTLRAAGADASPIRWHGLVRKGTVEVLARAGLVLPPEGDRFKRDPWSRKPVITWTVRLAAKALHVEAKAATEKKTCPCCFRPMAIKGGSVVRHGWRETGGRQVGSYGNTWHVGSCYGTVYAPYEVSSQGTYDWRKVLQAQRVEMVQGLEALKARPATLTAQWTERDRVTWKKTTHTIEVADDGVALEDVGYRDAPGHDTQTGSYAWNLKTRIPAAERALANLDNHLDFLTVKIDTFTGPQPGRRGGWG